LGAGIVMLAGGARRSDRRRTAYSRLNDVVARRRKCRRRLTELYNWWIRCIAGTSAVVPEGLVSLIVVCILVFTGLEGLRWSIARVGAP
jgi:hypothetical protein